MLYEVITQSRMREKVSAPMTTARLAWSVITSYSIHYTKLYERPGSTRSHAATTPLTMSSMNV